MTPTPPLALPALPESEFCSWMQRDRVMNAFPWGVGDPARWDHDGHWAAKGFRREPLFTADQMNAHATAAILSDRAGRGDADSTIHRLQQPCKGKECGTTDSRYHSRACYLGHEEIVMYAACLAGPDEPAAARWEPIGWQYRMVFPTHASKWMDFLDLPVSEMATTKDFKYETRLVYAAPTGEAL